LHSAQYFIWIGFVIILLSTIITGECIIAKEKNTKVIKEFEIEPDCQGLLNLLLTKDLKISKKISEKFQLFHNNESYINDVNFVAEVNDLTSNDQLAKALNLLELNHHNQSQLEVYKCYKDHLGTSQKTMKLIKLSNDQPSLTETVKTKVFKLKILKEIRNFCISNPSFASTKTHLLMLFKIASQFIDLTKDIFLLITVMEIVPISLASVKNFGGQVVLVLLASTVMPEIANLITAWKPDGIQQSSFLNILFLFIAPILSSVGLYISCRYKAAHNAILFNKFVDKQDNLQTIKDLKMNKSELDYYNQREKVWKDLSIRHRLNEMLFEHTPQVLVLLIFTALILTKTKTVQGLEQLFTQVSLEWIIISAILSFRSLTNHFKIRADHQKFYTIPLLGKVILSTLFFFSVVVRFMAVILYFAPGLGLLNLLMHWQMGNIAGIYNFIEHVAKLDDPRKSRYYFLFGNFYEMELPDKSVMDDLVGNTFEKDWRPIMSYEELTFFKLETYYLCFLVGAVFHFIAVFVIKQVNAIGFSSKRNLFEKVLDVFAQTVAPTNYRDWDEDENFAENWRKVDLEIKSLLFLFTIENICMMTPLAILFYSVHKRDEFLYNYFPLLNEEVTSTNMICCLLISMPILFLAFPFFQYFLFTIYHRYGHPWSKIFVSALKK
jgi:hypothetical protein